MANNEWDDQDEDLDGDLPKRLRAQLKAKDKELREAQERLGKLEVSQKNTAVKEALKSAGVNPKIAALIPSDIEASDEAIGAWLTEYADVFNIDVGGEKKDGTQEDRPLTQADEDALALAKINGFVQPSNRAPSSLAEHEDRVRNATSPEELAEILKMIPSS